jgi:hypothetical protein
VPLLANKYNVPMKLVALLNAMNVRAEVPDALQASAHRTASKTDVINSANPNTLSCDATLRMKILLSGLLEMNKDVYGRSKELLYEKKMVNPMDRRHTGYEQCHSIPPNARSRIFIRQ